MLPISKILPKEKQCFDFARRSYQLETQNLYFCSRVFLQSRIAFWQLQMILLDCMVVLAVTDVAFSFTESSY